MDRRERERDEAFFRGPTKIWQRMHTRRLDGDDHEKRWRMKNIRVNGFAQ